MIYVMEKQKTKDINKNIIDYINSNLDKKFIVLTKDLAQTNALNKKITRECICVGRKHKENGTLNPWKICDAVLNKKEVILMHYNYLPYFYQKMRDIIDDYSLIVTNAVEPLSSYADIGRIGKPHKGLREIATKTEIENGLEYLRITFPVRFVDSCLWSTRSLVPYYLDEERAMVLIFEYPNLVLNSFKNVMIYTDDFYVKLKKVFDIYCPNYHVVAPDTIDGYFE